MAKKSISSALSNIMGKMEPGAPAPKKGAFGKSAPESKSSKPSKGLPPWLSAKKGASKGKKGC